MRRSGEIGAGLLGHHLDDGAGTSAPAGRREPAFPHRVEARGHLDRSAEVILDLADRGAVRGVSTPRQSWRLRHSMAEGELRGAR